MLIEFKIGSLSFPTSVSYFLSAKFKDLKLYASAVNLSSEITFSISDALHENCPNTEFFLVRIFLYLFRIQENKDQKKPRIWTLFTQLREFRVRASYFSTSVIFVCKFTFYFSPKVLLSVAPRILRLLK